MSTFWITFWIVYTLIGLFTARKIASWIYFNDDPKPGAIKPYSLPSAIWGGLVFGTCWPLVAIMAAIGGILDWWDKEPDRGKNDNAARILFGRPE